MTDTTGNLSYKKEKFFSLTHQDSVIDEVSVSKLDVKIDEAPSSADGGGVSVKEKLDVRQLYYASAIERKELQDAKLSTIIQIYSECIKCLDQAHKLADDELQKENVMVHYHKECFELTAFIDYSDRFAQFVSLVTTLAHEHIKNPYHPEQIAILKYIFEIALQDIDLSDKNLKEIFRALDKYHLDYQKPIHDIDLDL